MDLEILNQVTKIMSTVDMSVLENAPKLKEIHITHRLSSKDGYDIIQLNIMTKPAGSAPFFEQILTKMLPALLSNDETKVTINKA